VKISIITVVRNNESTIRCAIESVLSQSYQTIEYIVIDGASTDGTIEIINSYGDKITQFISEQDNGIYDAMNKGINLSTGDVIGILNSDDFYENEHVLKDVMDAFQNKKVDAVYGDLLYVSSKDPSVIKRIWESRSYSDGLFQKGWHPAHPTFFVNREIYNRFGVFNLDFKIAADYELMLRFIVKYKITLEYLPKTLVRMRLGGESNGSIFNIVKANRECLRSWGINDLRVNPLIFFAKPFYKILQYVKALWV